MPSLGGYGVAELEPFESQGRGFAHGHRKKYAIPKSREHEIIEKFRTHDPTEWHNLAADLKAALLRCVETLQYEASTLPAQQMGQTVLPEKFTKKQQSQSRLDGGIELDGSQRPFLVVTAPELPGHHELEKRKANAEGRPPLSMYTQVSLQGCHQSLMPSYRLPQNLGARRVLDEVGMHCSEGAAAPGAFPPRWVIDEDAGHVEAPFTCHSASVAQPASREDIDEDANQFALSYVRDFRALHQFNHDHDCTTTCIKYVAKQCRDAAQEAIRKGKVVACRFLFFHIMVFTYLCTAATGLAETVTKRIRRRGKKLVQSAYIAITNERNEFCKPVLPRDTPFRSASTDVGQNWGRCNIDFQFMPRTLDPEHFLEVQPAVLQVNPRDALAMYGVRMRMPDEPILRRTFHAMVAMFQASHNCDFYITKYHAKPMEQLQSLLTNIALGLRRLEAEEEATQAGAEQPADSPEDRARKTTLKIANAANRSSWCSCCEMAIFIKTGALVRKTHRPIAIFLSRPLYLYEECRRLLQSSHEMLIQAQMPCDDQVRHVDVLCFTSLNSDRAVQPGSSLANQLDCDTSAQPADCEPDDQSHSEDADSNAFDECNVLADGEEPDDVEQPEEPADGEEPADDEDAEQPEAVNSANSSAVQPAGEAHDIARPCDDGSGSELEEELVISTFNVTTSAHDDWLHRGPFLFDMDFHTYIRFTVRRPCPKEMKISDADRIEHVFLFEPHYALAASHWQLLVTEGVSKLVVMEALRCPPPSLNNGEDNAVFKSLIGTLIKCPGPGHCADPLLCKAGFFQVTVPKSTPQTPVSELPAWIDHERFSRTTCPLSISRNRSPRVLSR